MRKKHLQIIIIISILILPLFILLKANKEKRLIDFQQSFWNMETVEVVQFYIGNNKPIDPNLSFTKGEDKFEYIYHALQESKDYINERKVLYDIKIVFRFLDAENNEIAKGVLLREKNKTFIDISNGRVFFQLYIPDSYSKEIIKLLSPQT